MTNYEGDTQQLIITFYNFDKNLVTPDSATYKIIDQNTKTTLKEETTITPLTSTVTLLIPGEFNTLLDPSNVKETKVVIIYFTYTDMGEEIKKRATQKYTTHRLPP